MSADDAFFFCGTMRNCKTAAEEELVEEIEAQKGTRKEVEGLQAEFDELSQDTKVRFLSLLSSLFSLLSPFPNRSLMRRTSLTAHLSLSLTGNRKSHFRNRQTSFRSRSFRCSTTRKEEECYSQD